MGFDTSGVGFVAVFFGDPAIRRWALLTLVVALAEAAPRLLLRREERDGGNDGGQEQEDSGRCIPETSGTRKGVSW